MSGKILYGGIALAAGALALFAGAVPVRADTLLDDGTTIAGMTPSRPVLGEFIERGFLLNYGTVPNGSGRTVSGVNIAGGFSVFQAFDVPAPGWNVTSIGVDGWLVTNPAGVLQSGTICADDGTLNAANCAITFGTAKHTMGNDPFSSNWADAAYNVNLAPGRYWYRSSSQDANYWAAIFGGVSGPGSYSIQTSTGNRFDAGVTALRIDGTVIPEPGSILLLASGLGLISARRRR